MSRESIPDSLRAEGLGLLPGLAPLELLLRGVLGAIARLS